MKITRLFFISITGALILFACSNLAYSIENSPTEVVMKYFQACENGDVSTIKSLITDHFYQRRKVLIEENQEYPAFLRSHYSGMQVEIVSTQIENANGNVAVMLEQIFPDGNILNSTLILKKNMDGNWKISDEMLPE